MLTRKTLQWHLAILFCKRNRKIALSLHQWIREGGHHDPLPTVEIVAKQLGVTHEELVRFFRLAVGKPFVSWRKDLRISEAKDLLVQYPHLPVYHIGEMVGIGDKSDFRKQFKELTGMTPSQYRKHHLTGGPDEGDPEPSSPD